MFWRWLIFVGFIFQLIFEACSFRSGELRSGNIFVIIEMKAQVNLCQKHSFLHLLTQNMTTDCSLNYKLSTWKIQVQYILCTQIVLSAKTRTKNNLMYTTCTELVIFSYWTRNSMNNLLSYLGLVDARMSASDMDLLWSL